MFNVINKCGNIKPRWPRISYLPDRWDPTTQQQERGASAALIQPALMGLHRVVRPPGADREPPHNQASLQYHREPKAARAHVHQRHTHHQCHPHPVTPKRGAITILVAQTVKRLPAPQVSSPGREEPLEKQTATHSSVPAWKIPWTEERGGLQAVGSRRVRHDRVTSLFALNNPSDYQQQNKYINA